MSYIKKFMAARLNDPIDINLLNRMLNSIEEEFKLISKGIASHASRHHAGGGDEIDHDLLISTLVGYWPLDKGFGMVAYDHSKYGNHGSLENMTEEDWVDGKVGKALELDGVDDKIVVSGGLPLQGLPAATFALWIKSDWDFNTGDQTGYQSLIGQQKDWNDLFVLVQSTEYYLEFDHRSGGVSDRYKAKILMSSYKDIWCHVVAVFNAGNYKIYVNGELKGNADGSNTTISGAINGSDFVIGDNAFIARLFCHSLIDEVRIYKRALTADEVKALFDKYG